MPPPLPPIDTTIKRQFTAGPQQSAFELVVTAITDQDALYQFVHDNPDLQACLLSLAQRAVTGGADRPRGHGRREGENLMTLDFKVNRTFGREDYEPYVGKSGNSNPGLQELPNAEDVDPIEFLNHLASGGHMMQPVWGYALSPASGSPAMDPVLPDIVHDERGATAAATPSPTATLRSSGASAICKHEVVDHAGANHNRGWHPGHCVKCGYDMTCMTAEIDMGGLKTTDEQFASLELVAKEAAKHVVNCVSRARLGDVVTLVAHDVPNPYEIIAASPNDLYDILAKQPHHRD